jgi:hypothetical protein
MTHGRGRVVPRDRTGARDEIRFTPDVGEDGRRVYGDEPAIDARPSAEPLTGFPPFNTDDRPRT